MCFRFASGQILIDKKGNNGLNVAALHVAAHMQEEHEFYFRLSEGDKDTFVSLPNFFVRRRSIELMKCSLL